MQIAEKICVDFFGVHLLALYIVVETGFLFPCNFKTFSLFFQLRKKIDLKGRCSCGMCQGCENFQRPTKRTSEHLHSALLQNFPASNTLFARCSLLLMKERDNLCLLSQAFLMSILFPLYKILVFVRGRVDSNGKWTPQSSTLLNKGSKVKIEQRERERKREREILIIVAPSWRWTPR
jgi:hypothetical protein